MGIEHCGWVGCTIAHSLTIRQDFPTKDHGQFAEPDTKRNTNTDRNTDVSTTTYTDTK